MDRTTIRSSLKKTKKSRPRPARLSWPPALSSSQSSSTTPADRRLSSVRKKPRLNENENRLWVDKYAPTCSQDLCVAPKKVDEIRSWLQDALLVQERGPYSPNKLLILVGSPGIGKSTMIRVLAKELDLNVHSWTDSFVARDYSSSSFQQQALSVATSSAMDSFQEFLQSTGAGFLTLQLSLSSTNNTGSSSSSQRNTNSSHSQADDEQQQRSILLLEELPNMHHNLEREERFREMMSAHLQQSQVPTILIFSDVLEGKHNPHDLERLIDKDDLYHPSSYVTIRQIHPVTKAKMKKVLDQISQRENGGMSSHRRGSSRGRGSSSSTIHKLSKARLEELHLQSSGDIRHAIHAFQFQSSSTSTVHSGSTNSTSPDSSSRRDEKLSTFHALGKLLYAKRKPRSDEENGPNERNGGDGTVLAFDADNILLDSDMGVSNSLQFLGYHSVDFFTDISDMSAAFDLFSDASTVLDQPFEIRNNNDFNAEAYASSIAGRAVGHTNKHPAASKFRQFSTPTIFHVMRNRRQNDALMASLTRRLTTSSLQSYLAVTSSLGSKDVFVSETLPFLRILAPNEVNPSLENLYSTAKITIKSKNETIEAKEREMEIEQEKILEQDDIEDFD